LKIEIRTTTLLDSNRLINLADGLIRLSDWYSRELMLQKSLRDSNCNIYIAEVNEKIVGFIELHVFPDFVEGAPIAYH